MNQPQKRAQNPRFLCSQVMDVVVITSLDWAVITSPMYHCKYINKFVLLLQMSAVGLINVFILSNIH